jgi:Uma2 family endonuclease
MSELVAREIIAPNAEDAALDWVPPMPPTDLVFDDGEPLETPRHRTAMNALIRSALVALANRDDYFVGGNMFVYFSSEQARNRDFRGPDFLAVLNVDRSRERLGWVVWEEGGRYPDVIIELMSSSTAAVDTGIKKEIYEQVFRTPNYFVFHPFEPNSLKGWHLDVDRGYQELEHNERGWLWCQRLSLWLGTWEGEVEGQPAIWLRFYDSDGNLVLLPEEAAEQKAEVAEQKAEAAEQKAEAAEQRANAVEQRAEAAEQRAQLLAARLQELGENLDELGF